MKENNTKYFSTGEFAKLCKVNKKTLFYTYLVGYLKGYYDKAPILYERLLKYIEENNLIIIGSSYEDVLIDEVAVKNTNDYVLKVSIQIKEL